MLHTVSFWPGVPVQNLPREKHSPLPPREDTNQHSKTEGKEAPAAKGHRAFLSRKQALCLWRVCRIYLAGGEAVPMLQQGKCRDKFPQTNTCSQALIVHYIYYRVYPLLQGRSKEMRLEIQSLPDVVWSLCCNFPLFLFLHIFCLRCSLQKD